MLVTQKHAVTLLGEQLVLHIDPRRLTHQVNCKKPISKRLEDWLKPAPRAVRKTLTLPIRKFHPFAVSERWFPETTRVEVRDKYRKVQDLYAHRHDVRQSHWFATLQDELQRHGMARHKKLVMRSEAEILAFFEEYVGKLIRSMETNGYRTDRGADTGTATIGRDGTLYKGASGNHRFYVARLLGACPVPLRVTCVHRGWLDALGLPPSPTGIAGLGEALQAVAQRYR